MHMIKDLNAVSSQYLHTLMLKLAPSIQDPVHVWYNLMMTIDDSCVHHFNFLNYKHSNGVRQTIKNENAFKYTRGRLPRITT